MTVNRVFILPQFALINVVFLSFGNDPPFILLNAKGKLNRTFPSEHVGTRARYSARILLRELCILGTFANSLIQRLQFIIRT